MFWNIFTFEIRYWLRKPSFYVYSGIIFALSLFIMVSAAGIFESLTVSMSTITIVNSATAINGLLNEMAIIVYFFLPAVVGGTIYRDYKHEMHSVLYSYPFKKWEYLLAKFLSGIVMITLIVIAAALGLLLGSVFPGTNPELLGPFELMNYVQPFFYYIIPNMIFFGAIVFGIVTFTRNISVGFIVILALFLLQSFTQSLTQDLDNKMLAALLDPLGMQANSYYTEYWTVFEQNNNPLPWGEVIFYNRLLWTGLGIAIFGLVYKVFDFRQQPISFNIFGKKKGEAVTKKNFGSVLTISMPKVDYDYTWLQNLKTAWSLSTTDFKYIVRGWAFIIISLVGLLISLSVILVGGEIYGTDTLPVTWQMLELPGTFFSLFINILTFLYAGMILHRSRSDKMDQLIHVTATPNWVILFSKFLALVKMQMVLLAIIMVTGIGVQLYNGFFDIELGLYLTDLYGISLINVVVWGLLALFIHSFFKNFYIGFILLLLISIGINFLGSVGIEQDIFKFNQGPGTSYSDMNGYGSSLPAYFVYKIYWLMLGIVLFVLSITLFRRGMPEGIKERFQNAKQAFSPTLKGIFSLSLIIFLSLGSWVYYTQNIKHERLSSKEQELRAANWEKNYGKYKDIPQPRIIATNINLDLYPETRDFEVAGSYLLQNKTGSVIDSIHIDHNNFNSSFGFERNFELVMEDDSMNYDIYRLNQPLMPGDSVLFTFVLSNKPNEILRNNSPVRGNGTFINNSLFPGIGYSESGELSSEEARERYDLPPKDRMPPPTDSTALQNNYISNDADWIEFETTISTSPEQIAIAPGYLQDEWEENGRRYFHYKMDSTIVNFYSFISAEFAVTKDTWNDVAIEIYHHPDHTYNLDYMKEGIKKSLDYYTENYSPYQFRQLRIIEFPRTGGSFAQSFANTVPYSEAVGFIADVDTTAEDAVNYPFSITAHEVAHQWWAHQVIGANVQGATMLSESLSEYSALKVLEKEYGVNQMRRFLKDALDGYLIGRTAEFRRELPLIYNENQQYIHYDKGSLVFYALSDYTGEDNLNRALSDFVADKGFQQPPYTTSLEMLEYLKAATPDSLQYLIKDMFETITLYDNRVEEATYTEIDSGTYEVDLTLQASKYRSSETGERVFTNEAGDSLYVEIEDRRLPIKSLPLNDWIEVGVFGMDEEGNETVLYLEKRKFREILNEFTITVDEEPVSVGIDPYNKLIDTISNDNRRPPSREDE
ncbi:ABC transporter permease/M1 family aminopeptidase [Gracilimonas sp.]|uniref:ABC transporter permease/M1 family aminopeptidase n=1 Tax=Gracilimonas sp. TaxID=1974203 RepID=UPI0028718022|nr:M1 family aminopeptidase [Gracilimonas sp.]